MFNGRHSAFFHSRSVLLTAVILSLAAGAHVLGGGVLPEGSVLALLAVLTLLPVVVLGKRRMSLADLVGVLGGGQVLMHAAFAAFSGPQNCTPAFMAGISHHAQSLALSCAVSDSAASAGPSLSGLLSPMAIAHFLAVIVTAWAIARGERSLEHLWAWVSARVPDSPPVLSAAARPRQSFHTAPLAVVPWRNAGPHFERGPPALSGAAYGLLPTPMPA